MSSIEYPITVNTLDRHIDLIERASLREVRERFVPSSDSLLSVSELSDHLDDLIVALRFERTPWGL